MLFIRLPIRTFRPYPSHPRTSFAILPPPSPSLPPYLFPLLPYLTFFQWAGSTEVPMVIEPKGEGMKKHTAKWYYFSVYAGANSSSPSNVEYTVTVKEHLEDDDDDEDPVTRRAQNVPASTSTCLLPIVSHFPYLIPSFPFSLFLFFRVRFCFDCSVFWFVFWSFYLHSWISKLKLHLKRGG